MAINPDLFLFICKIVLLLMAGLKLRSRVIVLQYWNKCSSIVKTMTRDLCLRPAIHSRTIILKVKLLLST